MAEESADDDFRIAPDGQIWVRPACGRANKDRWNMGDTSCVTWAVLCYERADGEKIWQRVPDTR